MHSKVVQQDEDRYRTLRPALQSNGIFSGFSGAAMALAARSVADFMGINPPAILVGLGLVLILFGVDLFWVASRPEIDRRLVWTAVILDIAWVIGSYAILLVGWPPLTLAGKWTVVLLAEAVSIFAIWQYIGLRRASTRS